MTDQTEQTPVEQSLELTLQDLHNLRSVIDTAARRGAYAAKEFVAVGTVYNKLNTFLNSINPAPKESIPNE